MSRLSTPTPRRVSAVRGTLALLLCCFYLVEATFAQTPVPSTTPVSSSAPPPDQSPAPYRGSVVPAQILAAHTVFLANLGADPNFPIDVSAAYNDIYAALQSWGRYQLVGSPEQADLVFQLHDIAPISDVSGYHGDVSTTTSPAFQLTVLDPHLNTPLFTVTSPVLVAGRGNARRQWTMIAETNLVSRLKVLANQPLTSAESDDLTRVPRYRSSSALPWILTGSLVGAAVAGGFLLHHAFENSLASQKASQDAFCKANNIPLSECAGG